MDVAVTAIVEHARPRTMRVRDQAVREAVARG
jgi:hypothetical protein